MSENEAQEASQLTQMKPYLIAAGALCVIVIVAFLWPSSDEKSELISAPIAVEPVVAEEVVEVAEPEEPEVFVGTPDIQSLEIEASEEFQAPAVLIAPEPLDESDTAIKNAFVALATSPLVAKYLVDESLLQKFVININSIANKEISPNHNLVTVPEEKFKVYQQAELEWIDTDSFKRYNTYVDALESMDTNDLLDLMDTYRPTLEAKFAEISPPNSSFDSSLLKAINELLDTPIVPLPIEVYSDSVVYKFKDEQLEALSAPQKQLIRTGPENTRRIKDILRSLKDALEN